MGTDDSGHLVVHQGWGSGGQWVNQRGQGVEQSPGLLKGSSGVQGCSHLSRLQMPSSSFQGCRAICKQPPSLPPALERLRSLGRAITGLDRRVNRVEVGTFVGQSLVTEKALTNKKIKNYFY